MDSTTSPSLLETLSSPMKSIGRLCIYQGCCSFARLVTESMVRAVATLVGFSEQSETDFKPPPIVAEHRKLLQGTGISITRPLSSSEFTLIAILSDNHCKPCADQIPNRVRRRRSKQVDRLIRLVHKPPKFLFYGLTSTLVRRITPIVDVLSTQWHRFLVGSAPA